jgi:hypothetical protein
MQADLCLAEELLELTSGLVSFPQIPCACYAVLHF